MKNDLLVEMILTRLLEKFGVKMGDAEHVGVGVPDERAKANKKRRKPKRR